MTRFDELKARYPNAIPIPELRANVSIVELARHWGYESQPQKGQSRPVLAHPGFSDTIIIKNPQDAARQVYQRAGDFTDSGTIIDFIRNRLSTVFAGFDRGGQHELSRITAVLYDYLRIDSKQTNDTPPPSESLGRAKKRLFAVEEFDLRPLAPDNFLTRRHIALQTLKRPEFANRVFSQVAYLNPATNRVDPFTLARAHPERGYVPIANVAFPYYNGPGSTMSGLEIRNDQVKLHASGSDRYGSVFVSTPPAQVRQAVIVESALDALSYQQLRSLRGDEHYDSVYFSTGGQLTGEQVQTITRYLHSFAKRADWQIKLAFDNDATGHQFDLQFIQQVLVGAFPLSPAPTSPGQVSYLLPGGSSFLPLREALLARIHGYNARLQASPGDSTTQVGIGGQLITTGQVGHQVAINIPLTSLALSAINQDLLALTGFTQRIVIDKAEGKDFNDDLTRLVDYGQPTTLTNKSGSF
jgi:hypothetical protein